MVTRWKSTISTIRTFIRENKKAALGILCAVLGLCILYGITRFANIYYYSLNTVNTWLLGIAANVFLTLANLLLMDYFLKRAYGSWLPKDESFFEDWQVKWHNLQRTLIFVAIPAGFVAYIFFSANRYYFYNYAFFYLLIATVLLQYGVSQLKVIRFMKGRLSLLMERMAEINRKNLEAAIEIERESIEKAAKSEQLKVDLISNVSHDLKTPLTSMVGYIELMKKEELDDTMRDYVEVLSDKAEKLKVMIESLFSLAKASSGNIKMHMESISLNRLVDQIFADLADRIDNSGLHFVKIMTEEDTYFISDNLHMYRICQNLIENALKYSAKGTRVFVKTYLDKSGEKERVCLEITNTAGYLMDFDKEDIIERFARADEARTSEGNGLGLAIVSTYTSALGGAFDINIDCDQFKASLSFEREELGNGHTAELLGITEYLE